LLLSALWQGDIDRQQALALSGNGSAAWRTAAMAHGSKCRQCHVDSQLDQAEHRLAITV